MPIKFHEKSFFKSTITVINVLNSYLRYEYLYFVGVGHLEGRNSIRRILHCTRFFYLDNSNGAAIANRALIECLARLGFGVEVVCGPVVDAGAGSDPTSVLAETDPAYLLAGGQHDSSVWTVGVPGVSLGVPPNIQAMVDRVSVSMLQRSLRRNSPASSDEATEFLSLFHAIVKRWQPDVLVTYGGDYLTREILSYARRAGIATVFTLHNFSYSRASFFEDVDAILVPSRFSADYYQRVVGIDCKPIPYLIDWNRVRANASYSQYVTFVNPSAEKGVFVFARIADEMGRRRPDIKFLVVESRGDEGTLVGCGIDLRLHGNVFLMSQTSDPREFWSVTRICLMPSIWWESQGLVAVEAMIRLNSITRWCAMRAGGRLPAAAGRRWEG